MFEWIFIGFLIGFVTAIIFVAAFNVDFYVREREEHERGYGKSKYVVTIDLNLFKKTVKRIQFGVGNYCKG